jgi:hypothetical protein
MDQTHLAASGDRHVHAAGTADSAEHGAEDPFDDEDYPAYSMGAAAEMLQVSPTFL